MSNESKRIEFWNFLTTEKNQARPKGITVHRLAVIKPAILGLDDVWSTVIDQYDAGGRTAAEFYQSKEPAAVLSRTDFWAAVRSIIMEGENKTTQKNNRSFSGGRSRFKADNRKRSR